MAVAGVTVIPLGTGSPGVGDYVRACVEVLKEYPDLTVEPTPMSTVIEGDLGRILEAVKRMHEVPFGAGALRVVTHITIDERRDKPLTIRSKLDAVRR
ncbi:MAG: thiamine-binding protein [Candidatus Latescibacterota bacterium]|nr:MTH1187 family thiamine-binding protein [Candidatus Latescibacterota bacterium]RKY71269.1 MAG: thiamine-binding protein [Candidatus Latescibacterota bacterium]